MYPPLYAYSPLYVTTEPVPLTDRDVEVYPFSAPEEDEDGNPITLVAPGASLEVVSLTTGAAVTGKASLVSYAGRTAWIRVENVQKGEMIQVGVLLHRSDLGRRREMLLAVVGVA